MKYVDEYREGGLGARLLESLRRKLSGRARLRFMEVCGTHTVAIYRSGLRAVLPEQIELLSGPGCPVCVTAQEDIDRAIELARQPNTVLITYGDMVKVPGTRSSLQAERARGADVRVVYSASEALAIAQKRPQQNVVFLGVGFETTVPMIALVLRQAQRQGIDNLFVLSVHKVIPPALRALLESGEAAIDGLLLPGHVSAIIGSEPYRFIADEFGLPAVVSGFEPLDVLQSIHMLVDQIHQKRGAVEIQYRRVVKEGGNRMARQAVDEVFAATTAAWRGLGAIEASGLKLRERYRALDAEQAFEINVSYSREPAGCRCGEMLRGIITPFQCPLFGRACSPERPVGPCMVSSEGTCAAYYRYGDWQRLAALGGEQEAQRRGDGDSSA